MKKLIILSDWEHDSVRRQQVKTAINTYLKDAHGAAIECVAAGTESLQATYILKQLLDTAARYDDPSAVVILVDILSEKLLKDQLEDEDLLRPLILKLKNGTYIVGPNRDNVFSLIKPTIEAVFKYPGFKLVRSFPARDSYSRIAAHLVDSLEDELDLEEVHLDAIPALNDHFVGYVDTLGDIYTTLTIEDLKGHAEPNAVAKLRIGETNLEANYVLNQYQPDEGEYIVYPSFFGSPDNAYLAIRSTPALHHIKPGTPVILG